MWSPLPEKSPVTHSRRSPLPRSSVLFQLMLWFPVTNSVSVVYSFSLSHFFHPNLLIHSLSPYLSPVLIRPRVTLSSCHYRSPFSVSVSNLHLLEPWGLDYQLHLSFCPSRDGLRFCCEMCGWEKKVFSLQKNGNLSFFSLGSQPVKMDLLPAVSLSVSRNDFYSVWRSQWGHAAGTTSWPDPLTLFPHYTFLLPAPLPINGTPLTLPLWS